MGVVSVMPQARRKRDPVFLLVPLDELPRHGGAGYHDRAQRGQIVRMILEVRIQRHPNGWDAGGEGDTLVLDQRGDVLGLKLAARENHARARHYAGEGKAPTVGMKHRNDLENGVALGDGEDVGKGERKAVQKKRTVRVQHGFGMAGGARGVAGGAGGGFIERRPGIRLIASGVDFLLVIGGWPQGGCARFIRQDHEVLH